MSREFKIGVSAYGTTRAGVWGGYIERIHPKTERATVLCYWFLCGKELDYYEVKQRKVFKIKNLRRPNYAQGKTGSYKAKNS